MKILTDDQCNKHIINFLAIQETKLEDVDQVTVHSFGVTFHDLIFSPLLMVPRGVFESFAIRSVFLKSVFLFLSGMWWLRVFRFLQGIMCCLFQCMPLTESSAKEFFGVSYLI